MKKIKLTDRNYTKKEVVELLSKVLELAAENSELVNEEIQYGGVRAGGSYYIKVVDKQSILNTINQIE